MGAPPFSLKHLDHVVLRTSKMAAMRAFYGDLGCPVVLDRHEQLGLVQLRLGTSMLDLVDVSGPLGGEDPQVVPRSNVDHFAVRIEPFDADAILAFCTERDIPATLMAQPLLGADGFGPAVYIEDPEGNRVELKGPPEAPPPA